MTFDPAFTTSYLVAFAMGLATSLHCVGMCGSIIGTLTLSLSPEVRSSKRLLIPFVFNYNLGRITSYTLAGAIAGIVESFIPAPVTEINGYRILQILSAVIMAGAGFYIAGWLPRFAYIEKAGVHLWKMIEPYGRKLIPVKDRVQAFLFGMVWGWLPLRTGLYGLGSLLDDGRCQQKCLDHALFRPGYFTCGHGCRYNDQCTDAIIKDAALQAGRRPVHDRAGIVGRHALAKPNGYNNNTYKSLERSLWLISKRL